ncbi:MAG: tail fiber protein [Pseudolabrys sp.]|nr:tail fiber protein [Pseudolabrys sp.]
MSQPFVGEIRAFGFTFAPRDWAFCNGQQMLIQQNAPLYSILGTNYGGNGTTTFNLPNLQGQIPMHWGHSNTGLATVLGEVLGAPSVSLSTQEMPAHQHQIFAADPGNIANRSVGPTNTSYLSALKGALGYQKPPVTADAPFSPNAITPAGSSLPHDNMQPYLALNFCICLFGVFPSRN